MSNMMRRAMMALWFLVAACGSGAVSETEDVCFDSQEADAWVWEDDLAASGDSGEAADYFADYDIPVEEGAFGWSCEDGGDCIEGHCVPDVDGGGYFCTKTCSEDCPDGYYCRLAPQSLPDPILICLPAYPAPWCRPCRETADCADLWADDVLDCQQISPADGSFCTRTCDEDSGCPEGFACQDGRCLPPDGCTCLEGLDSFGWETDCVSAGADGQCGGVRVCLEEGVSPCSAKQPTPETCNGVDDDCDGTVDPEDSIGCVVWWKDEDGDGSGGEISACICEGLPGFSQASGDCDDDNPGISPAVPEVCNGLDDDCDGEVDEPDAVGCVSAWLDEDGDGWGGPDNDCVCDPVAPFALKGGDCDDQQAGVNPGAQEVCNGLDDDCDGSTDEPSAAGCVTAWLDEDGDGWGGPQEVCLCEPIAPYVTQGGDCDDSHAGVNPGAPEACNGLDDDCDGLVDEPSAVGCVTAWLDGDGDGWGGPQETCLCEPTAPYVTQGGDCDDQQAGVNPGAPEACNGLDDDCDGLTDEGAAIGCNPAWLDGDGDGWGGSEVVCICVAVAPYVLLSGDCDDSQAGINPASPEVCNGLDDDCDGLVDEALAVGCVTVWLDEDGDGWGGPEGACLCAPAAPYLVQGGDCNDQRADIFPGAPEICDGLDQDCDGMEGGCDLDNDGWCEGTVPNNCTPGTNSYVLCLGIAANLMLTWCPEGFGDCDDDESAAHPGAEEICDQVDNDCNGEVDEVFDMDGDGWCAGVANACCPNGGGDCNDNSPWFNPGMVDIPDPGLLDMNCDGLDGDISDAVFVAPYGHDSFYGNITSPKRTIQAAINQAVSLGRSQVLVSEGEYTGSLSLADGISVHGRYTASGGDWTRHAVGQHRAQVLSPDAIAVNAIGLGAATKLVGLEIQAADPGPSEGASVVVFADESPGLTLADLSLTTGDGGAGAGGSAGQSGASGNDGEDGHDGCNSNDCVYGGTCGSSTPNGAGNQFLCYSVFCACGGKGQSYSTYTQPEEVGLPYPWSQGQGGQHSCRYRYHGPGKGGKGGAKGTAGHKNAYNGQDGSHGQEGTAGSAAPFGHMYNSGWVAGHGGVGLIGKRGYGGGGGGKGKYHFESNPFVCDTKGGEGGGGGEGGSYGSGGDCGKGGRSVFGVLVRDAAIQIMDCDIYLGAAGKGGKGGNGGTGGAGGSGGEGGSGKKGSGAGGDGGDGGRGGHGGGGAGGRGGHAIGILLNFQTSQSFYSVTVEGGTAGSGGQGGWSAGNSGPSGQSGVKADFYVID